MSGHHDEYTLLLPEIVMNPWLHLSLYVGTLKILTIMICLLIMLYSSHLFN